MSWLPIITTTRATRDWMNVPIVLALISLMLLSTAYSSPEIDQAKVIHIGTTEWPPFFSDHFKDQGYLSDVTKNAFANVGLATKIHFVPWMRAMKLAKLGQYDGVLGAYWNAERAQDYYYSDVLVHVDVGFVILKKNQSKLSFSGDIDSLQAYVIGIMKGHVYSDAFDQATHLKKRGANDIVNMISWLLIGDVDMIVGGQQVLIQIAKENFPARASELQPIMPLINRHALHVMFAKQLEKSPLLVEQFNKGLAQLKASDKWKSLAKKHGFEVELSTQAL